MTQVKKRFKEYMISVINNETLVHDIDTIINSFDEIKLKKNDYLVNQGAICKHFCYVESGILQHAITISGEEKTTYLALNNSCTAALKSFLQQTPSRKHIKALSDCNLFVINLNTFNSLLKNEAFHTFYFNLIENQIFLIDDYRIDLLTLSPEDRYRKLLIKEYKLIQQVPLHYLSSFLGISNRHMSRIRKEIK